MTSNTIIKLWRIRTELQDKAEEFRNSGKNMGWGSPEGRKVPSLVLISIDFQIQKYLV